VVFVTVGENNGHNVIESMPDGLKVGEDEVDTGLCLLREQHPTIDDEKFPVNLKNRHVPADFADTAERHDAEGPRPQRWWLAQWLGHTALARRSGDFGQRSTGGGVSIRSEVGEVNARNFVDKVNIGLDDRCFGLFGTH